jgi:DNA (cytosine-5)-methyltransferase 1
MSFTFGSLFSGIGGIDLGLERTGMQCQWQVEIDEYASKVLQKHWPNVARFRDIRTVGRGELEAVDLIAGGFPCQDISGAGRRAGITGERSGLWSEFYRIICELRPRYVLVENVAALLYPIKRKRNGRVISIEPAPISRVLGDLAACGYDAEWQVLSAEAVGAPHLRERVFIVGYAMRLGCGRQRLQHDTGTQLGQGSQDVRSLSNAYRAGCNGRQLEQKSRQLERAAVASEDGNRQQMAYPDRQGLAVGQVFRSNTRQKLTSTQRNCSTGTGIWTTESSVGRVANGIPDRMDRLRGLGNAVVPQVAEFVGRCILEREKAGRAAPVVQ